MLSELVRVASLLPPTLSAYLALLAYRACEPPSLQAYLPTTQDPNLNAKVQVSQRRAIAAHRRGRHGRVDRAGQRVQIKSQSAETLLNCKGHYGRWDRQFV